jgi:hypothetical protein
MVRPHLRMIWVVWRERELQMVRPHLRMIWVVWRERELQMVRQTNSLIFHLHGHMNDNDTVNIKKYKI